MLDAIKLADHVLEEREEVVALNVPRDDEERVDIGAWAMHTESVRAKRKDLAAAVITSTAVGPGQHDPWGEENERLTPRELWPL